MTATAGQIGYTTTLSWGDGASPEVFTPFLEVSEISGIGFTRDDIDFTHLGSPDGYTESVPGMKKPGEVSVKANWVPLNEVIMKAQADAGALKNYQANTPGSLKTYCFAGRAKTFDLQPIQPEGKMEILFAIKLSGPITTIA